MISFQEVKQANESTRVVLFKIDFMSARYEPNELELKLSELSYLSYRKKLKIFSILR